MRKKIGDNKFYKDGKKCVPLRSKLFIRKKLFVKTIWSYKKPFLVDSPRTTVDKVPFILMVLAKLYKS